jgi:hypothetical protein
VDTNGVVGAGAGVVKLEELSRELDELFVARLRAGRDVVGRFTAVETQPKVWVDGGRPSRRIT